MHCFSSTGRNVSSKGCFSFELIRNAAFKRTNSPLTAFFKAEITAREFASLNIHAVLDERQREQLASVLEGGWWGRGTRRGPGGGQGGPYRV
jgi:hypothetical protein